MGKTKLFYTPPKHAEDKHVYVNEACTIEEGSPFHLILMLQDEDEQESRLINALPHGSGINGNWIFTKSRDKFFLKNFFALYTEAGYHIGDQDFTVVIPMDSPLQFSIQLNGPVRNRAKTSDLRGYLEDTIYRYLAELCRNVTPLLHEACIQLLAQPFNQLLRTQIKELILNNQSLGTLCAFGTKTHAAINAANTEIEIVKCGKFPWKRDTKHVATEEFLTQSPIPRVTLHSATLQAPDLTCCKWKPVEAWAPQVLHSEIGLVDYPDIINKRIHNYMNSRYWGTWYRIEMQNIMCLGFLVDYTGKGPYPEFHLLRIDNLPEQTERQFEEYFGKLETLTSEEAYEKLQAAIEQFKSRQN